MLKAQRICGIINSLFFFIWSGLFGFMFYKSIVDPTMINFRWTLYASIGFLVIFILNLIAAIRAPESAAWRTVLLIIAIIFMPFGLLLGILNILSFKYATQFVDEYGEIRRGRRMSMRERKERMGKKAYFKFRLYLLWRKIKMIVINLLLLIIALLHSIIAILVFIAGGAFGILIGVVVYFVTALLFVGIKGVNFGSSENYDVTKVTEHYRWQEAGLFQDEGYVKTGETRKTERHTRIILSGSGALYLLFGSLMFIPQFIAFLLSLFIKSNTERVVLCRSWRQIPRSVWSASPKRARTLGFLFGIVPVTDEFLDIIEDKIANKRRRF